VSLLEGKVMVLELNENEVKEGNSNSCKKRITISSIQLILHVPLTKSLKMLAYSVHVNVNDLMHFPVVASFVVLEFSLALFNPLSFVPHYEGRELINEAIMSF
jgi:hypothetical protein